MMQILGLSREIVILIQILLRVIRTASVTVSFSLSRILAFEDLCA